MCGILGTIPQTDNVLFEQSLNTLYHRGPDDSGIEHVDNDITLGHRRLSILDTSYAGHQPMQSADKRYYIIFNGEIYNFLEIRQELIEKNYTFKSESDTEVVLTAFIEWGDECLLKFNGMWALAIWDRKQKELFLSRDRFGKKPLFYAFVDNKLIFASEMKAIYPFLAELEPADNIEWMTKNQFLYESTDNCLIKGIKRFPAGHFGYYRNGKLVNERFWNTLDHLVVPAENYEDQVKEFRDLFLDACRIRMRSDVPIGTALSGGLDSSATISTMSHISNTFDESRNSDDWQHAFVASFPDSFIDETPYAKKVTDHLGIDATYIQIDPLKAWDKLSHFLYMFEELFITSPVPMIMLYQAVKEKGVTVTIDGHGADELFSGYGHLIEALWDVGLNFKKIDDIFDTLSGTRDIEGIQVTKESNLKVYLNFMLRKLIKKGLRYKNTVSRDAQHANFIKMDNFTQNLYIIFHETILPTLLRNYDRYSMINSVEIRMPFMDNRLVSYVFSLPYSSKFGKGYTKRLIRDALAPLMPKEIAYRKAKIGFNSPIVDWMQKDLKEWFINLVSSDDFMKSKLVSDPLKLREDVLNITSGKVSEWRDAEWAWTRLTPYLWGNAVLERNI